MANALVVVPTYCEAESLEGVVRRLLDSDSRIDILIVDDNSPDGTGELADRIAERTPRVTVLHRPHKSGLGKAYLAGFAEAAMRGSEYVIEIDADGSHQPEQLPTLLDALEAGADLAIGTRWMPGGEVHNWPLHRRLISRAGTRYARLLLRSKLRDITSGFRGYRVSTLQRLKVDTAHSQGYCFQIELAWRVERADGEITEFPISFIEREQGQSKMSFAIVAEAMWRVTLWGIRGR